MPSDRNGSQSRTPANPDGELIRRARAFDEAALSWLFDTYYPRVYNYGLVQLRDTQSAEDLASDVMLRVLGAIPRYRACGIPFSAWVFRIARNRLVDIRRRQTRRREVGLADCDIAGSPAPHAAVERALNYGEISLALSRLTEVQQQVIVLRFLKDFDVATVARILGRSESAVKSLQFRALASLRRIMQGTQLSTPTLPQNLKARHSFVPGHALVAAPAALTASPSSR